ncbi:hypothetical protein R8Z50_13840 [Longispora sp. K20-0274]|uniref:hypothetical protein n=1 Tax=Longispora sp. K20-0274 TaxID=3088255 RepID=UPI00399ABFC6
MSTDRLRTLFDETTGPDVLGPPGVDVDAVIGRERTARTRRRWLSAGGATLAVAALALALPGILGRPAAAPFGAPGSAAPATSSGSPAAPAPASSAPAGSGAPRSRQATADALTTALGTRIHELLPAATFAPVPFSSGDTPALRVIPSQADAFKAWADITDQEGASTLTVAIRPGTAPADRPCPTDVSQNGAVRWDCTWRTLADGSPVMEATLPASDGVVMYQVLVYRSGYWVSVSSANYDENSAPHGKNVPRPTPKRTTPAVDLGIAADLADRLSQAL